MNHAFTLAAVLCALAIPSTTNAAAPGVANPILNSASEEYFREGSIKAQHGSTSILNTEVDEYFPVGAPAKPAYGGVESAARFGDVHSGSVQTQIL
jgi:hypothetical protein